MNRWEKNNSLEIVQYIKKCSIAGQQSNIKTKIN